MISSFLRASLVTLAASVVAVSAAPATTTDVNLTVIVSPLGSKGDGSENMKVITTVANTGNKPVRLLKDPRRVLSSFPEDSFTITGPTGSHPPFNGVKVEYNPKYAANLDDRDAYTVLAPGDKIDVIHDLTKAYDFTKSGTGEYSVEPSNLFTIVDADGTPKNIYATVGSTTKIKLSGDLPASRVHDKRTNFMGCSADQQSEITTAISSAQSMASDTYSYIMGISSSTTRFSTWFGEYDEGLKSNVEHHFKSISGSDFQSFTYYCAAPDSSDFAFVDPDDPGAIYLLGAFWKAPLTGTNSKAGTLIYAASHFIGDGAAKDYAYGQTKCKSLATSNQIEAILNADSHRYFAENNPPLD